ncbi:hypothetical protein [Ochrobactrum soli]|uniref:Uncharacterized protein n=1 Tax=Ochrobactrum soli TaxID=2448455 RepID=A0A2P9HFG2_9HYPH|nr:hypothetical protein [[Ochrobactrum] soli]SPL62836.1 hypothetical protein OHAE_2768 [[Ochrobactrum] soli]
MPVDYAVAIIVIAGIGIDVQKSGKSARRKTQSSRARVMRFASSIRRAVEATDAAPAAGWPSRSASAVANIEHRRQIAERIENGRRRAGQADMAGVEMIVLMDDDGLA